MLAMFSILAMVSILVMISLLAMFSIMAIITVIAVELATIVFVVPLAIGMIFSGDLPLVVALIFVAGLVV